MQRPTGSYIFAVVVVFTWDDDSMKPDDNASYDDTEAARRRDEVVKRMLATPPQPRLRPTKPEESKRGRPPHTPLGFGRFTRLNVSHHGTSERLHLFGRER